MNTDRITSAIRDIPDFPKPGIIFKDITPVLSDPTLFREVIDGFAAHYGGQGIQRIAAIDARGFILGAALAYKLGISLVPVRKKGKLPYKSVEVSYELEYGEATLEIHVDALLNGEKVLIIDDLLATGGTAAATTELIEKLGGEVTSIAFMVELAFLEGRKKLEGYDIWAPVVY